MEMAKLTQRFRVLMAEVEKVYMTNTRVGYLAAAEMAKEASSVADLIGGAGGAFRRSDADQGAANCLTRVGDMTAAARAACSSLWAARVSGNRTKIVMVLAMRSTMAQKAPNEMAQAEKESREQERRSGSRSYGGLDLSKEGRVRLPTTPDALVLLSLAYNEAALAICDSALAAAGGRDSPAAADERIVPSLSVEAEARGCPGVCLHELGDRERSLELVRQAVVLMRLAV